MQHQWMNWCLPKSRTQILSGPNPYWHSMTISIGPWHSNSHSLRLIRVKCHHGHHEIHHSLQASRNSTKWCINCHSKTQQNWHSTCVCHCYKNRSVYAGLKEKHMLTKKIHDPKSSSYPMNCNFKVNKNLGFELIFPPFLIHKWKFWISSQISALSATWNVQKTENYYVNFLSQ